MVEESGTGCSTPVVGSLWIYPIKSLDGLQVDSVGFTDSGSLINDRRFCLLDADGRLVNGKRTQAIHRLRSTFQTDTMRVFLHTGTDQEVAAFDLEPGNRLLEEYLGQQLSQKIFFREDNVAGFLDDPESASITLVSQASLERVSRWFGWQEPFHALRRFRPNVVLDNMGPFTEDELAIHPGAESEFRIGEVMFTAHRLCTRCVVPNRNPSSGEPTRLFEREFVRNRLDEDPGRQINNTYGHAYLLSVCCTPRGDFSGKRVQKGDTFTR